MKTNPNDMAFSGIHYVEQEYPLKPKEVHSKGLTKREFFAAMAMQGLITNKHHPATDGEWLAEASVMAADALIEVLNKEKV